MKYVGPFASGIISCLVVAFSTVNACTGMKVVAQDGSAIHGRTLEFATPLTCSVAFVPRGYPFKGSTPLGSGLSYLSKYAAVGAVLQNQLLMMDGLNEKGLSVGTFYFPGYAKYTPLEKKQLSKALSPIDFPNWILTQFATLEEVKEALEGVVIAPTVIPGWGDQTPPFHYVVYDRQGNSLVIEPLEEKLVVYDNPLGVLTNSPTFDWHMTNLRNYINLRTVNASPLKVGKLVLAPFGQGSGMVGLPGDFTPPSRFVRAAIFSHTALASPNAAEAVFQLFHLLNQFDIPKGLVREVDGAKMAADYTMVTCVRDPRSLKYYFKTYEDPTIRCVDLNQFDFNSTKIKQIGTNGVWKPIDISGSLK